MVGQVARRVVHLAEAETADLLGAPVSRTGFAGAVVTVAGLAGLAAIGGGLDGLAVVGWLLALLAVGVGVGLAFPNLIVAAMTSVDDPDESAQASAGISTIQLLSNALFSALCGLLLALPVSEAAPAQVMAVGLLAVVTLGAVAAAVGLRKLP